MERLTYRGHNGKGYVRNQGYYDKVYLNMAEVSERLTAYEDIEMEPEEITANMEMFAAYRHVCGGLPPEKIEEALRRIAEDDKAREEGRLVVKPKCSECRYEKDVIGRCFHCLGSQRLEPDRSEAALGGGEHENS